MISPEAGGEAIVQIAANGSGTTNRNIQITFGPDTVEGAELRTLSGSALPVPYTAVLNFVPALTPVRLVVAAPARGCVDLIITDLSATPLNPGVLEVGFEAPCGLPPCVVNIVPDDAIVASGGTQQLNATTLCDGVEQSPVYTWEIVDAETTDIRCVGSSIDATGLYQAPVVEDECVDFVRATDTANGNAQSDIASIAVIVCEDDPVVTVLPASPECEETLFCALTTLCGDELTEGLYTWTVDGGTADTNSSADCILVTPSGEGNFTVTATGVATGASDSVTGDCISIGIEATLSENACGRQFAISFGIVTVQGTDTVFGPFTSLSYDSPAVIKGLKLVNVGAQTITQFVVLAPSIFFPGIIGPGLDYPTTVEVTVGGFPRLEDGLSDTFLIPACEPLFPGPGL
jgi:hypothetical protein